MPLIDHLPAPETIRLSLYYVQNINLSLRNVTKAILNVQNLPSTRVQNPFGTSPGKIKVVIPGLSLLSMMMSSVKEDVICVNYSRKMSRTYSPRPLQ